jgi:hypothetical protein
MDGVDNVKTWTDGNGDDDDDDDDSLAFTSASGMERGRNSPVVRYPLLLYSIGI